MTFECRIIVLLTEIETGKGAVADNVLRLLFDCRRKILLGLVRRIV